MSTRVSAGLLLYRMRQGQLEVLLAHPGGPLFQFRDAGYWSVPKGEIEPYENLLEAALREFAEEIGVFVNPEGVFQPLGSIQQKGGKIVYAWALEGDLEIPHPLRSSLFQMEWPPNSGKVASFPEVDRAEYLPLAVARQKIKAAQVPLLDRLEAMLLHEREVRRA